MARNERAQWAQLHIDGVALLADLAAGASLARVLDFVGPQLRCFGAAPASSQPLLVGDFSGRVDRGASCNASVLSITPHANGTHTEGVGHLTVERVDVQGLIPRRLLLATLLTVEPELAGDSADSSSPLPRADDLLMTRGAIERAWPAPPAPGLAARAAVHAHAAQRARQVHRTARRIGAIPVTRGRQLAGGAAASITWCSMCRRPIAAAMAASSPRTASSSDCRRAAARCSQPSAPGARSPNWLTSDDALADGWYLLSLQSPAICGDAVPSRPVLYPLRTP